MTLVPNETEQALNRQHDVYAAAREEYRKRIAELAAENERLRAALEEVRVLVFGANRSEARYPLARAALEEKL